MAHKARKQVDPFNAGDPVMPWEDEGEYVPLGAGEDKPRGDSAPGLISGSTSSEHDECWVEEEHEAKRGHGSSGSKAEAPSVSPRRVRRSKGDKREGRGAPPRTEASAPSWPAPKPATTKLKPAAPKGDTPFEDDAAPGEGRGGNGVVSSGRRRKSPAFRILMLVVLFTVGINVIGLVVSCSVSLIGSTGDGISSLLEGDSSDAGERITGGLEAAGGSSGLDYTTYARVCDSLEAQELETFDSLLGRAASADEDMVAAGAAYLDAALEGYCGLSYADLGIDSAELARWTLSGIERDESSVSVYAYSENDADTAYVGSCSEDITAPDMDEVAWQLSCYLDEEVDYESSRLVPGSVDEGLQERAQRKLESLKQEIERGDVYFYLDFTGSCEADGSNPTATLDESSWDYKFSRLFGAYA